MASGGEEGGGLRWEILIKEVKGETIFPCLGWCMIMLEKSRSSFIGIFQNIGFVILYKMYDIGIGSTFVTLLLKGIAHLTNCRPHAEQLYLTSNICLSLPALTSYVICSSL